MIIIFITTKSLNKIERIMGYNTHLCDIQNHWWGNVLWENCQGRKQMMICITICHEVVFPNIGNNEVVIMNYFHISSTSGTLLHFWSLNLKKSISTGCAIEHSWMIQEIKTLDYKTDKTNFQRKWEDPRHSLLWL